MLQATFNVDLGDRARLLWGGMYQDYDGNEVGGWNRLTQELVDRGTYVTGLAKPLDADGDGFVSHAEYDASNGGAGLFDFVVDPDSRTGASVFGADFALDPATVGAARLDGDEVLVARGDVLRTEDVVLYADLHYAAGPRWEVTNKLYFERYDHLSEVAYGFAEFADSRVLEDQLIVTFSQDTGWGRLRVLVSPSVRRTEFEHANDFANEHFDRRDLTGPSTARDRRLLATRIDRDYSDYSVGSYTTYALAGLADLDWDNGLNAVLGVRQERIDLRSRQPAGRTRSGVAIDADDTEDVLSWTVSVSYRIARGWMPYATLAEQTTVVAGQGAEILPGNVALGQAVATSKLREVRREGGLPRRPAVRPGRLLRAGADRLQRAGHRHQPGFPVGRVRGGTALAGDGADISLIAAYTDLEVVNLNTLANGGPLQLSRCGRPAPHGPGDVLRRDVGGFVTLASNPDATRAGVPEHLAAVTVLYEREDWRVFASVADVASVYSASRAR